MRRRLPIALLFVFAGVMHFVRPEPFETIVPPGLPAPRALVYASGVAEIAGGLGVLRRRTAPWAGWWLIATLLAVFPANVYMAVDAERFASIPAWVLWGRLPLQALLIAWVYRTCVRGGGTPAPALAAA